MVKTYFITDAF